MNQINRIKGPQSFLERSIKILVVDDDWSIASAHTDILNFYKLYDVTGVTSAQKADEAMSSPARVHVCLLDLGLSDIDNDEYYLIKKYAPRISFIIVSARDSLQSGFRASTCGACAIVNKPVDFSKTDLVDLINSAFLRSLIIPDKNKKCKTVIKDAAEAFISTKPASVSEWAGRIGIEERYLRKVWAASFGYQPKYVIWLYRTYSRAFSYYNGLWLKNKAEQTVPESAGVAAQRLRQFYHTHKKTIDNILKQK
jgi:DNA-binding NarL/FixJ family response regulator